MAHDYEPGEDRHAMHTDALCRVCGQPKARHIEPRYVRFTIVAEITGGAPADALETLLTQATVQIEDPHDDEGNRVDFQTRVMRSEWEEV